MEKNYLENKTLPKCTLLTLLYGAMCWLSTVGALSYWHSHTGQWYCFLCAWSGLNCATQFVINLIYALALLDEKPAPKKILVKPAPLRFSN